MQRYAIELRSITQGRGVYSMKFSHREPVPAHIAEGVIAAAKREREEGEEELSSRLMYSPEWDAESADDADDDDHR